MGHVQADERWVKLVGRKVWQAMAIAVPSRLWLGGALSGARDAALLTAVRRRVRRAATSLDRLVCTDGLTGYGRALWRAFQQPVKTGKVGRPWLVWPGGFLLGEVVKQCCQGRMVGVIGVAGRRREPTAAERLPDDRGGE